MTALEDNNEKRLFSKFQFTPIFCFQVMHDYVHQYCSIDYCVKFLDTRISGKRALIWPWNDFCSIPLGKCVFKGRATKRCKKFKCLIFENALCLKSGSSPLTFSWLATTIILLAEVKPVLPVIRHKVRELSQFSLKFLSPRFSLFFPYSFFISRIQNIGHNHPIVFYMHA